MRAKINDEKIQTTIKKKIDKEATERKQHSKNQDYPWKSVKILNKSAIETIVHSRSLQNYSFNKLPLFNSVILAVFFRRLYTWKRLL